MVTVQCLLYGSTSSSSEVSNCDPKTFESVFYLNPVGVGGIHKYHKTFTVVRNFKIIPILSENQWIQN